MIDWRDDHEVPLYMGIAVIIIVCFYQFGLAFPMGTFRDLQALYPSPKPYRSRPCDGGAIVARLAAITWPSRYHRTAIIWSSIDHRMIDT